MAKGQKRSNRETKKPKQVKSPPIPARASVDPVKRVVGEYAQRQRGKI